MLLLSVCPAAGLQTFRSRARNVSVKVSIDKYNIRYLGNNMDLKALIAKMDTIESKQILVESVAEPVAEPLTETVVETQSAGFKSNIAQQLLREFSLDEAAPVTNPWPEGSPQAQAWTKLSATDQKWIGQADPTDKFILARAPNKGAPEAAAAAPAAGAANPADMDIGFGPGKFQPDATPAPGAANPADMDIGFGPGKFQPDATPAPGAANPADMDIGFGPGKFQPDATPAPAAGAATKPAAKPKDPAVLKLQQDLIAKGAKIQADGIMGPETQAAMKQFGGTTGAPDPAKMKRFKELLAKAGATA
jgi:hypothetical protein